MNPNTLKNTRFFNAPSRSVACGLAVTALLAGCGGGDDPAPPANTLSGVAAVGVPIANGAVALKCSGGPALATTTNATGNFLFTLAGQTLPCAVQVNGGSIGGVANTTPYHSVAVTLGTVNITPLTNLMVAQLTGVNPQAWFGTPVFTSVNANAVSTALSTLSSGFGIGSKLGTINPITTTFAAQAGDPLDDLLEAFRIALANVGQNYAATLSAAQSGNYSAFTSFAAAFNNAFSQVAPPVTPPVVPPVTPPVTPPVVPPITPPVVIPVVPPVTPPASGSKRLTVEVSLSGSPITTVDVGNVPAPANQAEFCSELQNDATFQGLKDGGGTLTINSCSFAGNVGRVSATLGLTSPFPLTFPYSIKYTYN